MKAILGVAAIIAFVVAIIFLTVAINSDGVYLSRFIGTGGALGEAVALLARIGLMSSGFVLLVASVLCGLVAGARRY